MRHGSDKVGFWVSLACFIHCIALYFIPLFFSAVIDFGSYDFLEYFFKAMAVGAVYFSYKHAHTRWIKIGFVTCGSMLILSTFFSEGTFFHIGMLYTGSVGLMTSHIFNIKLCNHKHS